MSALGWLRAHLGDPEVEAGVLIGTLHKESGRAATDEELEALADHFEAVGHTLRSVCIKQLTAEAVPAINAWLEQHPGDYAPEAPVAPAEITLKQVRESLREPPKRWVAYVKRETLEDLGPGKSAASPIAALRLFIAWAKGAS